MRGPNVKVRRGSAVCAGSLIVVVASLLLARGTAHAEDALVEEGVKLRIDQQQIAFLRRTRQMAPEQVGPATQALQARDRALRQRIATLPRPQQQAYWQ